MESTFATVKFIGSTFIMISLPQRLHLTGKFLISVSGSSHSRVCLPHEGQRRRRLSNSISLFGFILCNMLFN